MRKTKSKIRKLYLLLEKFTPYFSTDGKYIGIIIFSNNINKTLEELKFHLKKQLILRKRSNKYIELGFYNEFDIAILIINNSKKYVSEYLVPNGPLISGKDFFYNLKRTSASLLKEGKLGTCISK